MAAWFVPALAISFVGLPAASVAQSEPLAKQIDALLDVPELQPGFVGVVVHTLRDHTTIYERNPDRLFLPASTCKLLTAAAALETLGTDWRFTTKLAAIGGIGAHGVLTGSVEIIGGGDPLLDAAGLDRMVADVKRRGIRTVTGSLLYVSSRFDDTPLGVGWSWDDEPEAYSAQIGALNFNENFVYVQVTPGKRVGDPAEASVTPMPDYVKVVNEATTSPAGTNSSITIGRKRGRNVITIAGAIPLGTSPPRPAKVAIENPARFAATALYDRLRTAGVRLRGGIASGAESPRAFAISAQRSGPLSDTLKPFLLPSDNLFGECLLKTLGANAGKVRASSDDGVKVESAALARLGIDAKSCSIVDGSGLSRMDLVSPACLCHLLEAVNDRPYASAFTDALPVAGRSGTLQDRMIGTAAENNCRAKTGTLTHVSNMAGYVTTADGQKLVFVIMINNETAGASKLRDFQDRFVNLLATYRAPEEPK